MSSDVSPMLLEMVKSLAGASEQDRMKMLETRLKEFAAMDDSRRKETMTQMTKALASLTPEQRNTITKSRLECLCELFDDAIRKKLISTHMQALMTLPQDVMM